MTNAGPIRVYARKQWPTSTSLEGAHLAVTLAGGIYTRARARSRHVDVSLVCWSKPQVDPGDQCLERSSRSDGRVTLIVVAANRSPRIVEGESVMARWIDHPPDAVMATSICPAI